MTLLAETTKPDALQQTFPWGRHGRRVFGRALLRSAGFPAEGLSLLESDHVLDLLDSYLAGDIPKAEFEQQYTDHEVSITNALISLLHNNEALSTAIAWQNPGAWQTFGSLASTGKTNSSLRRKVRLIGLYWQRYCSKAETIGYFGPSDWVDVNTDGPALEFTASDHLVARSHVAMEAWAAIAIGTTLAERPELKWWMPPILSPAVDLDMETRTVTAVGRQPRRVTEDEARVLFLADGTRAAAQIAEQLDMAPEHLRKILTTHERRHTVIWNANIPVSVRAWDILHQRVDRIGDPSLRDGAKTELSRFDELMDVIRHAPDARSLTEASVALSEHFETFTGASSERRAGQAYAARSLCYLDCTRAGTTTIGTALLESLDAPLGLVLQSADWFADTLAQEYSEAITEIATRKQQASRHRLSMADVWASTMSLFWGNSPDPLDRAVSELSSRWNTILEGLEPVDGRIDTTSAALAAKVDELFPVRTPIPELSVHSPDLQIITSDVDEIAAGNVTAVMGELHACLSSLDMPFLDWTLPSGTVRDRINTAVNLERLVPLFPETWRRNTGRMVPATVGVGDRAIGFTRTADQDRANTWSMSALLFEQTDDGLMVRDPSGKLWTIAQAWSVPISMVAADAFKIGLPGSDAPRLTIDNLVVFRRTWRFPTETLDVLHGSCAQRHALLRRWQRDNHLPNHLFVKFASEPKPIYFSFESPVMSTIFTRSLQRDLKENPGGTVTMSEVLPEPTSSWLHDTHGHHYVHEFRLQLTKDRHDDNC
ncbi:lantibiotic dehydratase [Cutibacterium sp. WCA-380-WT-3A]|uniref:Lantibiotic dehydratase n=1 Tax=Cutibacterium porci TaxID=2605781 RepID=A0A7K0J3U6_9ACTN|nr:lantibiotic dehydratase [Cutibacterium porci]MSS44610.1 lantibiotic dehydratase [Cutibacterium porci]